MRRGRVGKLWYAAPLLVGLAGPGTALAEVKVVTSILPLHSLVAGVMEGAGEPALLVKGGGSPHAYSLKPSEARALAQADLVFWIGEDLETFLEKPLESLAGSARLVEVMAVEGLEQRAYREGATWETHDHDDHGGHEEHADHDDHEAHEDHDDHAAHDDHEDHDDHKAHDHEGHGDHNPHVWLDPHNADHIVRAAVHALSEADPGNKDRYEANGKAMIGRIAALNREIDGLLAPVKGRPYVVFHDAYQHFEERFGLSPAGSITLSPDQAPGAKRLYEIRDKILSLGAGCVFSEPQFEPALVKTVVEGTDARTGVLDPLGAEIAAGPDAYFDLLRGLAGSLKACLSPES